MIDVAGGVDASICWVAFEGMKHAVIWTSGGDGDSLVQITHCTFTNLGSAMSTYGGSAIPDAANAICSANRTTTTTTTDAPTTTTTSTSTTSMTTMIPSIGTTDHVIVDVSTSETVVIVEPTTLTKDGGDSETTEDMDECDGTGVDTVDFLQISGSCSSCSEPRDERRITQCLKQSYYSYYSINYEVSWSEEDMVCDSLSVLNIEDGLDQRVSDGVSSGGSGQHQVMVDGQSTICRDRFEMRFKFDVAF